MLFATFLATEIASGQRQPDHRATVDITYESQQSLGKGVTIAEMSSGLTVIVRENHAAPVATVRCYVRNTGSVYEGKYLGTGVSHMLEHLVAGGSTSKRPEKEVQALIDSMGGRTNAFTSTNMTAYYINCPARKVNLAIDLVAESMQFATIPEDEYIREMGVVQRELEMGKADRSRVMYQAMKELVFTSHPTRHPIIGYLPVVQSVKREEVIDFYKDRYVPQNLTFVVVGDVKTDEVLKQVLENFKSFQRTTERMSVLPEEPEQASARSTRIEMAGETSRFSIGWPTVALQHPDLYPLDVASYLLTNGDSSRLARRLKIDEPLAISVDSASYTPGFVKGWFSVTVDCKPENVKRCREIILQEIGRLKRELASDKELSKVKRQKAAEHVFGQVTVNSQADSLGRSFLSTGDPLFDDAYVEGIQGVTPEQVRGVLRKYFRPERENAVTIAPIGSTEQVGENVAESAESPVIKKKLSNGMTVLVKRHAVVPMVSIQAFASAGIISDTHKTAGLANLSAELMTRGTEKYSGTQIAEYFDSIGGSLSMQSGRNTTYLTCAILKDDYDKSLDYVHQVLFRPEFPEDEFKKVQQLQLGRIAARKANPQSEILDFWSTQIDQSSPFSRTVAGTEKSVGSLSAADCKRFHKSYIVPNNMVLAVYGDIDPEKTIAELEKRFGSEPKSDGFSFPHFELSHTAKADSTARLVSERANTAMVLLSYPMVSVYDKKARATLELINTVLTGGSGTGGRLFNELRGQRLVYYVFGFQLTGMPPGYFLFLAQTRPETADEVIQRIRANIDKIRTEGIPEDEFKKAKQKLLAGHAMQNTTPSSQAFQASLDELYGLGYDYDKGYDERIEKVTIDDVKEVMNRYFRHGLVTTSSPADSAATGAEE